MKAALFALAALTATPACAFDMTAMTEAERKAFGDEVRAYLLQNPEVLIEVSQELDKRQTERQAENDVKLVAANADDLYKDKNSWVGGNPEGDLTLVEFIDYRCGYCRKAHADVKELVKSDGKIRYIIKEFPILSEESVLASRFAIATLRVAGPKAYEEVNAGFYEGFRGEVTAETLAAFAEKLGLDGKAIFAEMNAPEIADIIGANHSLGERLGVSGTPTFVIGDQILRSYLPLADLREVVKDARR